MMPDGLDQDKVSGGWALLQDLKLVNRACNDGRDNSERPSLYEPQNEGRSWQIGREPRHRTTHSPVPWRPLNVPTGQWNWNGHTIEVRAVPNSDVDSRIVVAVDGSKRFESPIDECNSELDLVRLSNAGLDVALRSRTEEAPPRQPQHGEVQDTAMNELFDRIRAVHPDPLILCDDEFARLDAWLKTHPRRVRMSERMQAARGDARLRAELDADREWRQHLRFTREYNRSRRDGVADGDGSSSTARPNGAARTDPVVGTSPVTPVTPKKPGRRGRKPQTDGEADRRIVEAWASGRHKTHAKLDIELGLPQGATKRAIDRHRHRIPKKPRKN